MCRISVSIKSSRWMQQLSNQVCLTVVSRHTPDMLQKNVVKLKRYQYQPVIQFFIIYIYIYYTVDCSRKGRLPLLFQ